ncbi:MAG: M50 family metallopeptidase [Verrucomicrobia bacterium]|nr:M50 family metallopeptidase [Verrucomicrobiota bacterium]MCH8525989.1 M50 family metallopeptidase [Kiritimatiellia bacterium]
MTVLRHLFFACVGLILLPALAGMLETLFALLVDLQTDPVRGQTLLTFLAGGALQLLIFLFLPQPFRSYVLAHELSHALAAWFSGARVNRLNVGKEGGSVEVSHTNLLITLAPYMFPFYSLLLLTVTAAAGLFTDVSPWTPLLPFALGFTGSFHLCFTLQALSAGQSDIEPYGPLGAYPIIAFGNLFILLAGIMLLTPREIPETLLLLARNLLDYYRAVWNQFHLLLQ